MILLEWNSNEKFKKPFNVDNFKDEALLFFSDYEDFIFKGASLLERINNNDNIQIKRSTKDINITNLGKNKEELKNIVNEFLKILIDKYDLSNYRIQESEKTITSDKYYTVDFIDVKSEYVYVNLDFSASAFYNQGFIYNLELNDVNGYDVNKIYSDKMSAISTKQIFSRIKDFVDIYNLSFYDNGLITFKKIKYFNDMNEDFKVGDFKQLLYMKDNVKKAFLKMSGITILDKDNTTIDKETLFETMYKRVIDFIMPFTGIKTSYDFSKFTWDPRNGEWFED